MLSNIAQLKVKSNAHPQNYSSGINMRQTHSITWKQQGYVGNYYSEKQLNSCVFCILTFYCYCIWLLSQSIFVYLLITHVLRLSLSIRVKFIGSVLIQPLSPCIFLSIWAVLRQPLGVWVYIYVNMPILILALGACIEIGTGLMSFIISGTVMPLCVYNETAAGRMGSISREWINIATGHPLGT